MKKNAPSTNRSAVNKARQAVIDEAMNFWRGSEKKGYRPVGADKTLSDYDRIRRACWKLYTATNGRI